MYLWEQLQLLLWWLYRELTDHERAYGAGRSAQWPYARKAHLAKHPRCVVCGGTEFLTVHHVRPVHHYPELELDPDNFRTVCEKPSRQCHLNIGHSGDWRAFNPNFDEDAALLLKRRKERLYAPPLEEREQEA